MIVTYYRNGKQYTYKGVLRLWKDDHNIKIGFVYKGHLQQVSIDLNNVYGFEVFP